MRETFYYTSGNNYELYLQVTDTTHFYDVIIVIKVGNTWKEDKAEYNSIQYNKLGFATKYQLISEEHFATAQNEVLKSINQTRESLKKLYFDLWTEYLIEKVKIEDLLMTSEIEPTDFYAVTSFKIDAAKGTEIESKRRNLYDIYNLNYQSSIFSNEDIFGKIATERHDCFLNNRKKLLEQK